MICVISWSHTPNLSLYINLVIAKYESKSQYVKLTQLWQLTLNCVKVSTQSYLGMIFVVLYKYSSCAANNTIDPGHSPSTDFNY